MLSIMLIMVGLVSANTIESSTMVFEGELTPSGDGYNGVIPMVVDGGYDVYAKEGATAWFGDGYPDTVWTDVVIFDYDAFLPNTEWDPDTPDWYQYSLEFTDGEWAVRNHPGTPEGSSWSTYPKGTYPAKGVPMSGNMNWNSMYATEDDVGAYLPSTGTPEIPGGAATKGGGAQAWDMDWSWGSEVVPLEHGGFLVYVEETEEEGVYTVTLIPSTIVSPREGDYVSGDVQISWDGTFGSAQLGYKEGGCNGVTTSTLLKTISSVGTYTWDTSSLDDGTYCIKIVEGDYLYDEVEVIKDTTPPEVVFDKEFWFTEVNQSIEITGSITDEGEIVSIFVNYGDKTNDSVNDHFPSPQPFSASHKYVQEGRYTITVTARDEVGNVGNNSVSVIVSMEEPDWIIPLSSDGQNLISFPFTPEDTDYKKVFGGVKENLDRFWAYVYDEETKSNKWKYKYYDGSWYGSTGFSNIVSGYGYIVFMENNDVLYGKAKTISQDPDSEPELPASVKLANGWNLIGHFGNAPKPIETALASLISLEGYPYWHNLYDVDHEEVMDMESEKGYWLAMKYLPDTATEDYYTYYP